MFFKNHRKSNNNKRDKSQNNKTKEIAGILYGGKNN